MAEITFDQVPQKVKDLFNKGFAAFERGNLDYAIDLLFICQEMEPRFLQARKFLRAAEMRKFKHKKRNVLTNIISMITNFSTYLNTMTMTTSRKTEQALISAEKLLRNDPLNVKFIKVFAQTAVNADLPEAAIQTLEIAREHYPNNIPVVNWLGNLYLKIGRTNSARECFEKLCEICPNDPTALRSLKDAMALDSMAADGWAELEKKGGTYRDIMEDSKEAELLEQKVKAVKSEKDIHSLIADTLTKIETEPGNINYHRALSNLYVQKKMFAEAIAILEKAMEINPGDPEIDNAISAARIQQFDYEISKLKESGDTVHAEAQETEKRKFEFKDLQERVTRYPHDLKLRYNWGVMLFNNNYIKEAIMQFQISQKNPKHRVKSRYYLAMCFKSKKQYDLAIDQMEKARAEIPTMDKTKKDICYELGEISEIMGKKEKAAEYYKQIYEVDIGYRNIAEKVEQIYNK